MLKEIADKNRHNPVVLQWLAEDYFVKQLRRIRKAEDDLRRPKYRAVVLSNKPSKRKKDSIYVYKRMVEGIKEDISQICFANLAKEICVGEKGFVRDEFKKWLDVVEEKAAVDSEAVYKRAIRLGLVPKPWYRYLSLLSWRQGEFREWRKGIKIVDDNNIPEIIT